MLGAIEIKAGLDPAGALERLGAMIKSFESTLSRSPNAETILVLSCITPEVERRLNASGSVKFRFILAELIKNERGMEAVFVNRVRSILNLVDKRL